MSKVLKVVAVVAAVVAVAASIAMTFGATAFMGMSLAAIAAAASTVSTLAALGAQALQKPPDMKGTVNEVMIGANMPVPYILGRTFVGGMKVFDDSVDGPGGYDNFDRTHIFVGTHAGPIEAFEKFLADYSQISFETQSGGLISGKALGFYGADDGYLWLNTRKGARPDTALTAYPGRNAFRGWTANHKLSGMACWSATMEFDEDGKRWASGIPAFGMVAKWVKIYDPRKDSTYPGGSGSHRWDDESTWEFGSPGVGSVAPGENPALHALAYARGRFMGVDNVKVVGAGISKDAIDIAAFVELANICDANDWTCGGAVYEAPGLSRWDNLKRILAAAAAEPAWVGGVLTIKFSAPKVALATITADDLADGEIDIRAMTSWKDRFNTIVPRYRSENHRWEYVQAEAVTSATYVTEDGETKTDEVQFDLCQDVDQAAQLAAYELVNRREFGPITLNVKPHLMGFRPGECLEIDLPEAGLSNQLATIISRTVDPANGSVQLIFESETTDKHAFALGQTGVAPPTPTLRTPEEVDETASGSDPGLATISEVAPIVITADYQGAVDPSDQLPYEVAIKRFAAGTDVTTSTAWSMTVDSGDITASIGAATGVLEITAIGSSGQITVSSVYQAIVKTRTISVTLSTATPPATGSTGGSTATDTSFGVIASTTHTAISDELSVTVGSDGTVDLTATLSVNTARTGPDGAYPTYGIWRWWNGSAWADVGTEVAASPSTQVLEDVETGIFIVKKGTLTVNTAKTGLTASATEKFQFYARNFTGTRTMSFSGTVSAVG